jgi:hypothetical protein
MAINWPQSKRWTVGWSLQQAPGVSTEEASVLSSTITEPVFSGFLDRFQYLIKNLPKSVPKASDYDGLAIFGARPCDFDDTSIPSRELWEEVVNKVLKSTFGWGMEENMDEIIR